MRWKIRNPIMNRVAIADSSFLVAYFEANDVGGKQAIDLGNKLDY